MTRKRAAQADRNRNRVRHRAAGVTLGATGEDLGTLKTRGNFAYWAGRTGDAAEELRLFQDLLPDLQRVLGKDHPRTAITRARIERLLGIVWAWNECPNESM